MGAKGNRIGRMKSEHPICYFCATNPTETEDHVPSRECFKSRVGPEGYAFPACKRCNALSSQLEQVIAAYLMMGNYADGGFEPQRFEKLLTGVANNNREYLPRMGLSSNEARRHYRTSGLPLPSGFTYAGAPIAELPAGNQKAFEAFARRLTCALYYKEVGHPLPLDFYISTVWSQYVDPRSRELENRARELFPHITMTNRRNTDIGPQFGYFWGYKPEGLFGYAAQFSESYYFMGAAVAPPIYSGGEWWRPHSDDIPGPAGL